MKTELNWIGGMEFHATCENNTLSIDAKAPLGKSHGMTPKELVATGLGGCTAMDVVALLKKHKQQFTEFKINVEISPSSDGHPIVFKEANIEFIVNGPVDEQILITSVELSQTKYCGVSAMLSKSLPINYTITLNNKQIKTGAAAFSK
ncbi:MAG: OsmC family protein [Bdellovibrionaceae bacterium]|nr:OsmC family protein [Pseudobdellovibrionaceae bacterium]NUM59374.1 OsmC family protein [Pseudobdellovibrionaceae bacterium]